VRGALEQMSVYFALSLRGFKFILRRPESLWQDKVVARGRHIGTEIEASIGTDVNVTVGRANRL
jgi:hypothetical protein